MPTKVASNVKEGDEVSWNWGNGQPSGKVVEVDPSEHKMVTKNGNTVTKKGSQENPAVEIEGSGQNVTKLASELNGVTKSKSDDTKDNEKGDDSDKTSTKSPVKSSRSPSKKTVESETTNGSKQAKPKENSKPSTRSKREAETKEQSKKASNNHARKAQPTVAPSKNSDAIVSDKVAEREEDEAIEANSKLDQNEESNDAQMDVLASQEDKEEEEVDNIFDKAEDNVTIGDALHEVEEEDEIAAKEGDEGAAALKAAELHQSHVSTGNSESTHPMKTRGGDVVEDVETEKANDKRTKNQQGASKKAKVNDK